MYLIPIRDIAGIFKNAIRIFQREDPLRLAASTAFFAVFAMPPILIILINVFGFIFSESIISGELFEDLKLVFGDAAAAQINLILENIQNTNRSVFFTILGVLFLAFIATNFLSVIQRSINDLWKIKPRSDKSSFLINLRHRGESLVFILVTGMLVLASLVYDVFLGVLGNYLDKILPRFDNEIVHWASHAISIIVITVWFAILFKYLPDAKIAWKAVWVGSVVTGILFEFGKYVLGRLLVQGNITSLYGAAGSVVLLLLFIFYSAMILFYGASFTKAYADYANMPLQPKPYAVQYEVREIEKDKKEISSRQ